MHDAVMYTILPFYRWNKFKKLMTLLKNMFDLDITIPMTWKSWSANEQNQDIWTLQNTYFYSMILVNVEVVTQRKKIVCIVVGSTSTYF